MVLLSQKRKISITVAVVAGALTGSILHGATARADRSNQLIATVNLTKVYDPTKWHRFQDVSNTLEHERQNYKTIIDSIVPEDGGDAAVPPVDVETLKKWIDLKESMVLNPDRNTDSNRKTISGYETQAHAATDRMSALIGKGEALGSAEKDELQKLGNTRNDAGNFLKQRAQDYTDKLQQHATADRTDLDAALEVAIKQVADDKNITYVLNSPPANQQSGAQPVVLYSRDAEIDITDQVLRKLK